MQKANMLQTKKLLNLNVNILLLDLVGFLAKMALII